MRRNSYEAREVLVRRDAADTAGLPLRGRVLVRVGDEFAGLRKLKFLGFVPAFVELPLEQAGDASWSFVEVRSGVCNTEATGRSYRLGLAVYWTNQFFKEDSPLVRDCLAGLYKAEKKGDFTPPAWLHPRPEASRARLAAHFLT